MNITDLTPYAINQAQATQQNWLTAQNMLWNALANNARMARANQESDLQRQMYANQYANQLAQSKDMQRMQDAQNAVNTLAYLRQLKNADSEQAIRNQMLQGQIKDNEYTRAMRPLNTALQLWEIVSKAGGDNNTLNALAGLIPNDSKNKVLDIIGNLNAIGGKTTLRDLTRIAKDSNDNPSLLFGLTPDRVDTDLGKYIKQNFDNFSATLGSYANYKNYVNDIIKDYNFLNNLKNSKIEDTDKDRIRNIIRKYNTNGALSVYEKDLDNSNRNISAIGGIANSLKSMAEGFNSEADKLLKIYPYIERHISFDPTAGYYKPSIPEEWNRNWGIRTNESIDNTKQKIQNQSNNTISNDVNPAIKQWETTKLMNVIDLINKTPIEKRTVSIDVPLASAQGVQKAISSIKDLMKNSFGLNQIPPFVQVGVQDNTGRIHIFDIKGGKAVGGVSQQELVNQLTEKLNKFGELARSGNLKDYNYTPTGVNKTSGSINQEDYPYYTTNYFGNMRLKNSQYNNINPAMAGIVPEEYSLTPSYIDLDRLINENLRTNLANTSPITNALSQSTNILSSFNPVNPTNNSNNIDWRLQISRKR